MEGQKASVVLALVENQVLATYPIFPPFQFSSQFCCCRFCQFSSLCLVCCPFPFPFHFLSQYLVWNRRTLTAKERRNPWILHKIRQLSSATTTRTKASRKRQTRENLKVMEKKRQSKQKESKEPLPLFFSNLLLPLEPINTAFEC